MPADAFELSLTEPDVAEALLSDLYTPERPLALTGPATAFSMTLRSVSAGDLIADRLRFTMAVRACVAPVDYFLAATGMAGRCRFTMARQEVELRPGLVVRYPNDVALTAHWENVDTHILRLPLPVIERVARERPGLTSPLRFEGMTAVSASLQHTWLRVARLVRDQLSGPGSATSGPLLTAQLTDLVASTALAVFPNTTTTTAYRPGPGTAGPATVRRAVQFIDAHASLPITVTDVARAAGTGPRALQAAFGRHLDTSPMAYLWRTRLEAAHRDLQAANPYSGENVTTIAHRWGFARPDRFADAYRKVYGVAPSRTLST